MLEALGRSARVTPLDDVLGGRSLYQPTWNVGVNWSGDPSQARRHSWYAEGSYNGTGFSDPAPEMKQAIDDLSAIFRDDLFTDAPNKAASGAVVTRGGYGGAFIFTGGVECAFPEWRMAARVGPAVVAPIGDAAVTEVRFDYSFTGGGIPFQESDRVGSDVHLVRRTRPRGGGRIPAAAPEWPRSGAQSDAPRLSPHAGDSDVNVAGERPRRHTRRRSVLDAAGLADDGLQHESERPDEPERHGHRLQGVLGRAGSSGSTSSASASASDRT